MLLQDVYLLNGIGEENEIIVRLLPNVDDAKNLFYSKKLNFTVNGSTIFKHYAFAKIDNKYVVVSIYSDIYDFIQENLSKGLNVFDLNNEVALKIIFKKSSTIFASDHSIFCERHISIEHNQKHIMWDKTEKDKKRVLKYLKNKKYTLKEMANKNSVINNASDFF
jgi:hypothetical protein